MTVISGAKPSIVPSLSSISATTQSLEPTRPGGTAASLNRPPRSQPQGKPARRSAVTSMPVVVVLPCAPTTATSFRSRSTSASISPRRTTGSPRAAACTRAGWPGGMADE
jgi:hypothetical protein